MATLEAVIPELGVLVRDVMVDSVHTAFSDESIGSAAQEMCDKNLRRIVVIDRQKKVVGVVSQRDVLRYLLLAEGVQESEDRTSRQIDTLITRERPITVLAEIPLLKAAVVLATNKIGCLPVVGPGGELQGLLSITDLVARLIGRERNSPLDAQFEFYSPSTEARAKPVAFIRRTNSDLVLPLKALEKPDTLPSYALLGYDPERSRILVKFVDSPHGDHNTLEVRREKDQFIIPAKGFVMYFDLTGKATAYDVTCHKDGCYLVLTPK